ncbi:MAG: hypothetical protein ACN4GZ_14405 [Acidimicrobiales bacterium]
MKIPVSARGLFYLAGILGMLVAAFTIEQPGWEELPSVPTLILAGALTTASLGAAGFQWATLLDVQGSQRLAAFRSVFVSQLSKYLPAGGLFQVASQVSLSESGTAASRFQYFVTGIVQLCAACPLIGLLLFGPSSSAVPRTVALLATPLILLAHPRAIAMVLSISERVMKSSTTSPAQLPGARLARAQLMAVLNIALLSIGFAVISVAIDQSASFLTATGAFALAWLAGFVVVPLPAGLGVREAALVGLLPELSPATVVLTGVILRLVGLASEVALAGGSAALTVRKRQ